MLPPAREVECGCDFAFQRPVGFDSTGRNLRVSACLGCGAVSVTESIVEEPRPHDVRCLGNVPLKPDEPVQAWLAGWPRVALGSHLPGSLVLLAPGLRCASPAALAELERTERELQMPLALRDRYLRAGVPETPPPGGLLPGLRHFAEAWHGMHLDESSSFHELITARGWAAPFAQELIARRPRFEAEIAELLSSTDEEQRLSGARLAADLRLASPTILSGLAVMLEGAPHSSAVQAALHAASVLRERARGLSPALTALARRVGDSDYYLRKRAVELAERCK